MRGIAYCCLDKGVKDTVVNRACSSFSGVGGGLKVMLPVLLITKQIMTYDLLE